MSIPDMEYRLQTPEPALADFVESFWMLINHAEAEKEVVILPDGRMDLSFSCSDQEPFHGVILGIETGYSATVIAPKSVIYAISFKLLAVEYVLHTSIAALLDKASYLPADFWGITKEDLNDFDGFCNKTTTAIKGVISETVDERKRALFNLIYATHGSSTVQEISDQVHWSSRQINRYFTQRFGISLKAYCNILRFRASFAQLKAGRLFPEQDFTDQAHFIKEIKRYSGVKPKVLAQNPNDRFIQFSLLPPA